MACAQLQASNTAKDAASTWSLLSESPVNDTVEMLKTFAKRSAPLENGQSWLGAIISTDPSSVRFRAASRSVSAAGFAVAHIPAAMPSQYPGKRSMLRAAFGVNERQSFMVGMTPYEIALLISHKRALRWIAVSHYSWGGVFEDDAYLHEAVKPMHVRHLIAAAFASAQMVAPPTLQPVLYLGTCKPQCRLDVFDRPDGMLRARSVPGELLRAGKCAALCTHAYALSRSHAATLFDAIFGCHNGSASCASECDFVGCYMDAAMKRYFQGAGEAWIVGGGFMSSWDHWHRGLFIQNRSSAAQGGIKHVGRSNLAKKLKWTTLSNDSAELEEQSCELNEANSTRPKVPLQRLIVTIDLQGRIGNLMFQAAMLVGVAELLRRRINDTQAVIFHLPSSVLVPAKEMFEHFGGLSRTITHHETCGRAGFQSGRVRLGGCEACALFEQEMMANAYQWRLLRRLEAWAMGPPRSCRVGFIQLSGYFQSFHYFAGIRHLLPYGGKPKLARAAPCPTTPLVSPPTVCSMPRVAARCSRPQSRRNARRTSCWPSSATNYCQTAGSLSVCRYASVTRMTTTSMRVCTRP